MKKAPELIHLIAMKLPSGNNLQSILTASKMQTVQATRPAVCSWKKLSRKRILTHCLQLSHDFLKILLIALHKNVNIPNTVIL
jgi:hypothetical protein